MQLSLFSVFCWQRNQDPQVEQYRAMRRSKSGISATQVCMCLCTHTHTHTLTPTVSYHPPLSHAQRLPYRDIRRQARPPKVGGLSVTVRSYNGRGWTRVCLRLKSFHARNGGRRIGVPTSGGSIVRYRTVDASRAKSLMVFCKSQTACSIEYRALMSQILLSRYDDNKGRKSSNRRPMLHVKSRVPM